MKRLFFMLTAVLMTVVATAQEQTTVVAQPTQLVCSGNTYFYGGKEVEDNTISAMVSYHDSLQKRLINS